MKGPRSFGGAVVERRLSTWKVFPGNECVRVNVTDPADDGAPIFPLILAVGHPSVAAMNDARVTGRKVIEGNDRRRHVGIL